MQADITTGALLGLDSEAESEREENEARAAGAGFLSYANVCNH